MNIIMILPELILNLIQLCPDIISILIVTSKTHYSIITKYIDHLILICDKKNDENFEKLLCSFIYHDIVYGFANLVNSTNYWLNFIYIEYSCDVKSYRILSFIFKYKNYYFMYHRIPIYLKWGGHTVLSLFIEIFTKNGLLNHLNKLIIGNGYCDDILESLYCTLDYFNFMSINYEIKNTIINLIFKYANHCNLNKLYLLNFACKSYYYKLVDKLLESLSLV